MKFLIQSLDVYFWCKLEIPHEILLVGEMCEVGTVPVWFLLVSMCFPFISNDANYSRDLYIKCMYVISCFEQ